MPVPSTPRRRFMLRDLGLDELSLVPAGANQHADVVLRKEDPGAAVRAFWASILPPKGPAS